MSNLTAHFTLEEFTASETAARKGIDNAPSQQVKDNLKRIAQTMEDVRTALGGKPIIITSGFRCSALNKLVGSKPTSKHVQGLACDFKCPSFGSVLDVINALRNANLNYDQLILEFYNPNTGDGWVHIGLGSENRKQLLTINSFGTFAGIHV